MTSNGLREKAARFRRLHEEGRLLLPNAWDAASARVFELAGFPAVATTSAGIAWARGLPDGERIDREAMQREIASIARAVSCPVTADIEAGYGSSPEDVAATIDAVIDAGAVGVNLEDSRPAPGEAPLFEVTEQSARLQAARAAADRRGVPVLINARTDTFLLSLGANLDERIAMTIERGRAYLAAGGDVIFVPGLGDPAIVEQLVRGIGGPVSLLLRPGGTPPAALFDAGACRISLGSSAMLATLSVLRDLAQDLIGQGVYPARGSRPFTYADAQELFP
ncbi:MAG TPA: isocitrate lyase/phosphoenolpyruvate mutase family protein [Vicinamibacterales bacterium]